MYYAIARRARAIRRSAPERFVRYTFDPDFTPQQIARATNRFHYLIRQAGYEYAATWHFEDNPHGPGAHAHLFQHGQFVPRDHLLDLGRRVGIGDLYIEPWRPGAGRYDYGMKAAKDPISRAQFIALNRGRLGSNTRGFWRDGPGGRPLLLRQAASTRRRHEAAPERRQHLRPVAPQRRGLPSVVGGDAASLLHALGP